MARRIGQCSRTKALTMDQISGRKSNGMFVFSYSYDKLTVKIVIIIINNGIIALRNPRAYIRPCLVSKASKKENVA